MRSPSRRMWTGESSSSSKSSRVSTSLVAGMCASRKAGTDAHKLDLSDATVFSLSTLNQDLTLGRFVCSGSDKMRIRSMKESIGLHKRQSTRHKRLWISHSPPHKSLSLFQT